MSMTVCLWNIQNYGAASPEYSGGAGARNNALRNSFIAGFVIQHGVEVLMIMEMQPGQGGSLADLVARLNRKTGAVWAYSYCGSAIKYGEVAVTGPGSLTNKTGQRTECYAVVWRTGQAGFTLLTAHPSIAQDFSDAANLPLRISQLGRPTVQQQVARGSVLNPDGGYVRGLPFPYKWDGNQYNQMNHWPQLGFPPTGRWDADPPSWTRSRRPVYVVAQLADGTLVPVLAYHAPSDPNRAYWGARSAGLARELYVVDNLPGQNPPLVMVDRGFAGGDFNYPVPSAAWPDAYGFFTAANGQAWNTGAGQVATPAPELADAERRTTVQLMEWDRDQHKWVPITEDQVAAYLAMAIDLGFNRPGQQTEAARIDLVSEVMDNPNRVYDEAMDSTARFMLELQRGVREPEQQMTLTGPQYWARKQDGTDGWIAMVSGAWGSTFQDWEEARYQYRNRRITTARCAAEFFNLFISDHLPLIATFH